MDEPYDFRLIDCNNAYANYLGKDKKEIVGEILSEKIKILNDIQKRQFIQVGLTGEELKLEFQSNLTGKFIRVYSYSPKLGQFAVIIEDITERKNIEVEVKKLALVAEKTDNPIVITNKDYIIEWVNTAFMNLTGYEFKELIGQKPGYILRGPESSKEAIERINSNLRLGLPFTEDIINYNKSGEKYWVELSVQPVYDNDGNLINFIGLQKRIDARKNFEFALLEAKEAAEKANRTKTEFLANMSHEIRTPLNAILGFSEVLLNRVTDDANRIHIRTILSSGRKLLTLIDDVLDLSKLEAGIMKIQPVESNMGVIVEEIKQFFQK